MSSFYTEYDVGKLKYQIKQLEEELKQQLSPDPNFMVFEILICITCTLAGYVLGVITT